MQFFACLELVFAVMIVVQILIIQPKGGGGATKTKATHSARLRRCMHAHAPFVAARVYGGAPAKK